MKKSTLLLTGTLLCTFFSSAEEPSFLTIEDNGLTLQSIVMSYGTLAQRELPLEGAVSGYPVTIFNGAKMKLKVAGGTGPYQFQLQEGNAEFSDDILTVTGAGNIRILISDSMGDVLVYTFNPTFFTTPDGELRDFESANTYCTKIGARLPSVIEVSFAPTARRFGELFSEWGPFSLNGSDWYSLDDAIEKSLFWNKEAWGSMGYEGHKSTNLDSALIYQTFDHALIQTSCVDGSE